RVVRGGVAQAAVGGGGQQRVVGRRLPQLVRQARGQLVRRHVVDAGLARDRRVAVLDEVHELGRGHEQRDQVGVGGGGSGRAAAVRRRVERDLVGGQRAAQRARAELLNERVEAGGVVRRAGVGGAGADHGAEARGRRQRGAERDGDVVGRLDVDL